MAECVPAEERKRNAVLTVGFFFAPIWLNHRHAAVLSNPAPAIQIHTNRKLISNYRARWFFYISFNIHFMCRHIQHPRKVASNLRPYTFMYGRIFPSIYLYIDFSLFCCCRCCWNFLLVHSSFSGKIHLRFTVNPITRELVLGSYYSLFYVCEYEHTHTIGRSVTHTEQWYANFQNTAEQLLHC